MSPTRAHNTGQEEDGEDKERHPITHPLQPLIGTGHLGQVEPSEKIPVHYVFDVEFDGRHDNPEHVPRKRRDQCQRQHYSGPSPHPVGGARGRGLVSHIVLLVLVLY